MANLFINKRVMGKSKHFKLGKTKQIYVPEVIAGEIVELVRSLDELEKPKDMIKILHSIINLKLPNA